MTDSLWQAPPLSLAHPALFDDPTCLPSLRPETLPPEKKSARKAVRVEKVQGTGGWYDEAVAAGQFEPSFGTRVALAIVRPLFPDSEPTEIITYDDGTVEIILGGGPSSGAMGGQVAAGSGIVGAAAKGKLLKEVIESGIDTVVQEATGTPVAPTALKSRRSTGRTNQQLVEDIAARAAKRIKSPGAVAGTKKHTHAKKVLDRFQRMFGDRGLRTEVSILDGDEVPYGTKGSVRLDVIEGTVDSPTAIYDYKFGSSTLTEHRVNRIRATTGYGPEVPIIEVHR